jgi:hypothetical protein
VPSIFLLSPAFCGGRRANLLLRESPGAPIARQLRDSGSVPVGELFSFVSGLYFRGKLAYASAFAARREGETAGHERRQVWIITPTRGLWAPERPMTLELLREFAAVDVSPGDARFREPLETDAGRLALDLDGDSTVVLLGSIASDKYVQILSGAFGSKLVFPKEFIGRGDMSRGALLLRAASEGRELAYVPFSQSMMRRGPRPPRLDPFPRRN